MSHPTMGAWIEIRLYRSCSILRFVSHPTMGAWIEIIILAIVFILAVGRTPRWVRGLKSLWNLNHV